MTESQLVITLGSILSAVIGALCIVMWSLFRDIQRKLSEIVLITNENSMELQVHHERIENNKAKIDRHERLYENDFAERQAELIIAKFRIMGYNGNGK
jgi:hypothetical protein